MNRRTLLLSAMPVTFAFAMAANPVVADAKKKISEGKHEEAIAALEAEYKKAPKNAEVKNALADAYYSFGEAQMYDNKLPPFRKYPAALRAFRKTVELNPNHAKAKEHVATIEGIYKSMGREVPK